MASLPSETRHATTVSVGGHAVLIEGASGTGKSDLALRLIDRGAALISDDYTIVRRLDQAVLATAPATIAGKIEVRGLGIIEMPLAQEAPVALVVALDEPPVRWPEPGLARTILGVDIPLLALDAHGASAPIKVELALSRIGTPA